MYTFEDHLSLGTRLIVSRKHQTLKLLHNPTSAIVNTVLIRNCTKDSNAMNSIEFKITHFAAREKLGTWKVAGN